MLKEVKEKFGVGKEDVLQTAQSQEADHAPCEELGVVSCWIRREGQISGRDARVVETRWVFGSLGEMADEVEREIDDVANAATTLQ